MSKPTDKELMIALREAVSMREDAKDPDFIAKSLLNMNYRLHYFENVFKLAERYLNFGQEEHDHQELLKAIEFARNEERRITNEDEPPAFGL